jgi:hypothetical protein
MRIMPSKKSHLFWQTLDRATYIRHFFRNDKERLREALCKASGTDRIFLTSSGRAGILLTLRAAGIGRNDEIFVPPYLSSCVLESVVSAGVASLRFSERTKAVLLYHHWGFPQNFVVLPKELKAGGVTIIEDCAHGFWGKTAGTRIGEFGDAAIFSLSKIFEMTYAGALRVNNESFLPFISGELGCRVSLRERWESLRGEWTYVHYYSQDPERRIHPDRSLGLLKWYATLITYPACKGIRGKLPRDEGEIREIFKKQNGNFLFLLKNMKDRSFILESDTLDEMAPLCYPFLSEDEQVLKEADEWLKKNGIFTGIYHFDVNRNMFGPHYKKCVPIPLYASLDGSLYESFIRKFRGMA